MAENKEGQEKTEEASSKRLSDSRDRGQVAKSQDVTTFFILTVGIFGVFVLGGYVMDGISNSAVYLFSNLNNIDLTEANAVNKIRYFVFNIFLLLIPLAAIASTSAFIGEVIQVKLKFASKKFTEGLNFKQIFNPFSGLKKIFFSKNSMFEMIKSFLKLIVLGYFIYSVLIDSTDETLHVMELPVAEIGNFMAKVAKNLVLKVMLVYALIAVADYFYQKKKFKKDMMMTKQETKEETKQMQGDPYVKARFRGLMRGRIMSLMMNNVQTADVVVTNPTHFAVAIKYDPEKVNAPYIVAKGADFMAAKIRNEADKYNIPIIENPPLTRTLFYNVEINQVVPESLFKTVAEILAYVYNLKNKNRA